MILTEADAKTKWCPHVRIVNGVVAPDGRSTHNVLQAPYNRIVEETAWAYPQGAACISSACTQWRWVEEPKTVQDGQTFQYTPGRGYCGLAGRP